MHERSLNQFRPSLEPLEAKQPLSAGVTTAHVVEPQGSSGALATQSALSSVAGSAGNGQSVSSNATVSATATAKKPNYGFLLYRITNPNQYNDKLIPPFSHVLVQTRQPIPGQVYNVLYVAVRNGTAQTFDASSGFQVKVPNGPAFPILTGTEQWKPGQEFVFYLLTKKYYPLPSQVHSGFEFNLEGARSVAIPGPSGIYLRVKYNPATFAKTLDWIVAYGPGAQGGKGIKFGLPDTAINEFVSAKTNRMDFGGYF